MGDSKVGNNLILILPLVLLILLCVFIIVDILLFLGVEVCEEVEEAMFDGFVMIKGMTFFPYMGNPDQTQTIQPKNVDNQMKALLSNNKNDKKSYELRYNDSNNIEVITYSNNNHSVQIPFNMDTFNTTTLVAGPPVNNSYSICFVHPEMKYKTVPGTFEQNYTINTF